MPQQAGGQAYKKPFCRQAHPKLLFGHPNGTKQSEAPPLGQSVEHLDIQLDQQQNQEDAAPADPYMKQSLHGLLPVCSVLLPLIMKSYYSSLIPHRCYLFMSATFTASIFAIDFSFFNYIQFL